MICKTFDSEGGLREKKIRSAKVSNSHDTNTTT